MSVTFDEYIRRILRAIEDIGFFDKDLLAEKLGMSKEQIELALREYFFGKSFAVRAYPNYSRLGLRYTVVFLDFSFKWIDKAPGFLDAMARNGFLVTWLKPFGGYTYVTHHAVPVSFIGDYKRFFGHLTDLGLLSGYRFYDANFDPEGFAYDPVVFDYRRGEWKERAESLRVERKLRESPQGTFSELDETDLLIVSQLERTSLQSLEAMARALGLSLQDVKSHLENHVVRGGLIKKHIIDIFTTQMLSPETAVLAGFCEGISGERYGKLLDYVLSHPYLGYVNPGASALEFALEMPWRVVPMFSTLLDKKIEEVKPAQYAFGASVLSQIHTFTIPYEHFRDGKWFFDEGDAFNTFQRYLENPLF
ncbi:hypothetical protein PQ610_03910 [Tardisphaera miroshnichenkoae]